MQIASNSLVWKPDVAPETSKKLQGSCEVSALKLVSSGGAAVVAIYDSATIDGATPNSLRWFLDASTLNNDAQVFESPLIFTKGVFAVLEQGAGTNPVVCVAARKYVA